MTLTCPYCGEEFLEAFDGQNQIETYDSECEFCGKNFAFKIEIEIRTTSYQASCLNGDDHEWKILPCFPEFMKQRVCQCGESEFIYKAQERQTMADKYYNDLRNSKLERFDL